MISSDEPDDGRPPRLIEYDPENPLHARYRHHDIQSIFREQHLRWIESESGFRVEIFAEDERSSVEGRRTRVTRDQDWIPISTRTSKFVHKQQSFVRLALYIRVRWTIRYGELFTDSCPSRATVTSTWRTAWIALRRRTASAIPRRGLERLSSIACIERMRRL